MFKLFLICFAIAIFHSGSAQIVWKDCGSKNGVLSSLEVEGCTATPCILKKGTEASMTVKFKQNIATTSISAKVSGVIIGVPIPFPLPEPNACNLGAACPAQSNYENSLVLKLPILNEYPSLSVDVRINLLTESNANIVCFQFPVKIAS